MACVRDDRAALRTKNGCLTRISHGESGTAAGRRRDGAGRLRRRHVGVLHCSWPTHCRCPERRSNRLYRYDTAAGTIAYIATVEEHDYTSNSTQRWAPGVGLALAPTESWYTTPDGRYLMFASDVDLAGYSTIEASPGDCPSSGGFAPNGHCEEVYRYHYEPGSEAGGRLVCLSCNPSGAAPVSNAEFARNAGSATDPADGPVRAMSNDGAYVFFATADALVPGGHQRHARRV